MSIDIYNQFKDFKAFEVVILNENQENQKLFCSILFVEHDKIIIEAKNEKNKNVLAKINDELKLYAYTENGIYSSTSRVLSLTQESDKTEYVITYPKNSKHSQRREFFRADMQVKFQIKVTPKNVDEDIILIKGTTRNICGKGMNFVWKKPFPEYSLIEVDLFFNEKTVSTQANLVYSTQIAFSSKPKFVNAFAFTSITTKDIDYIVKKCFLYQLQLRKEQRNSLD